MDSYWGTKQRSISVLHMCTISVPQLWCEPKTKGGSLGLLWLSGECRQAVGQQWFLGGRTVYQSWEAADGRDLGSEWREGHCRECGFYLWVTSTLEAWRLGPWLLRKKSSLLRPWLLPGLWVKRASLSLTLHTPCLGFMNSESLKCGHPEDGKETRMGERMWAE